MEKHAFTSRPDYVAHIDRHAWAGAVTVAGVDERWNMPAALFNVTGGFDNLAEPDRIGHHTIKWRVSGSRVHARSQRSGIFSDPMVQKAVCLQARGSRARYWANADLLCAHLYWQDDFVREVAIESYAERGDCSDLLKEDAFFVEDKILAGMTRSYFERALSKMTPSALEMDIRSLAICSHLVVGYSRLTGGRTRKLPGQVTPTQLTRAIEFMVEAHHEPLRLPEIAREVGVSAFEFCRGFHKMAGMPPHRWLVAFRIDRAKTLLKSTRKSISDIAAQLSYDDPSYFARLFKKNVGISPSCFRDSNFEGPVAFTP